VREKTYIPVFRAGKNIWNQPSFKLIKNYTTFLPLKFLSEKKK
jgi:hypothetical protein